MKIGIPKAMLYYRYGTLWETFFRELGCEVVTSGDTSKDTLSAGSRSAIDESCMPLKLYLGHVEALIGRCDYLLVPRLEGFARGEEFCVRFQGLYDVVRNTYPGVRMICYNLQPGKRRSELFGFLHMGRALGRSYRHSWRAYRAARVAQRSHDSLARETQAALTEGPGRKILIAGQPYLSHDPYVGEPVARLVREQGGVVLYSDRCDREECLKRSSNISSDLYWTVNKEIIGAIDACKGRVDGVILLSAFPCGTDSLVNELVLRRVKDVPIIQIVLDEQQALAGLQTRIESFLDILPARSMAHG